MKKILSIILLIFSLSAHGATISEALRLSGNGKHEKALEILNPLAEKGDVDALGNLGNMYAFGNGVEKDLSIAYKYWKKASEKHLGSAMGNIASLYMIGGGGLEKNTTEAVKWYKKAAEHRHFYSMLTLSQLYETGLGIEKNTINALAWSGLATTNSPSEQLKQKASVQMRAIAKGMKKEDITEAQKRTYELVKNY
ncbi:MAG: tetratricopeptide repeat protein [Arenicellales bacterium]